jgi:hypothetical protein
MADGASWIFSSEPHRLGGLVLDGWCFARFPVNPFQRSLSSSASIKTYLVSAMKEVTPCRVKRT